MHRRLADRVVNWVLNRAPWYRPREIAARERWTAKVHRESIATRQKAEQAHPSLASYGRVRIGR